MPRPTAERSLKGVFDSKSTARPDVRVAELAARQWGVVSIADLTSCGLTPDAIKARVRKGRLHRLHMGVYAVGHPSIPVEGQWLAAVKAGGEAALSHFAASAHMDFVEWDGRCPEITVAGSRRVRHPGIRVHRSDLLTDADTTIYRGIRVTVPTRTLIDLASVVGHHTLRRAVRQALSLRRVSVSGIAKELNRLGPRRGSANLVRILADGHAPTRSELEDVVLELIVSGGFERPDINVPLVVGGHRFIPDFRWPAQRLIVEADGAKWHDNKLAKEDDAVRQALLEAHGERVVRITWTQALTESSQTLARVMAAGAPRAPRAEPQGRI